MHANNGDIPVCIMNHRSIRMIIHHVIQLASYIPVNIILKMIVTCHEHVTISVSVYPF